MGTVTIAVVGGGFAGIAGAVAAAKVGAKVILFERTDMLSGSGLRAGRMDFNGKLVAAEEARALGGGEVFEALESIVLHRGNIVDELHGYTYDTSKIDAVTQTLVRHWGIELRMETRIVDVDKHLDTIVSVKPANGGKVKADAFVDCTGTSGGVKVCQQYGRGCVMCVSFRCPAYGDRVSIATRAGAPSLNRVRPDGTPGSVGSAVILSKASLDRDLVRRLEKEGVLSIKLPEALIDFSKKKKLGAVLSQRQFEFINLVDIGSTAKCVGLGYMTLENLKTMPGFENAQFAEPVAGGKFNKISKVDMCPRDDTLKVDGFRNLFAAGEKCGPGTGIAEAIVTGVVAGNNAVRVAAGKEPMALPGETVIGDFIRYTGSRMKEPGGLNQGYAFGMGEYFERMKARGAYTTETEEIRRRIAGLGLKGILAQKVLETDRPDFPPET